MKYELIKTDISAERTVMQDIVEVVDEVETVTGQEATDDYEVTITIGIRPTDGIGAEFSRDITVISNNSKTGFQVDEQRNLAVLEYIQEINGMI